MEDTLVSARMPRAKKETVANILAEMGSTASELINTAYDYVIAERALPRAQSHGARTIDDFARFVEESTLAVDWRGELADGDYKSFIKGRRLEDYESLA